MEKENLEYLQKAVKFAGFGDHFEKDIEAKMKENLDKFDLAATGEFGKSKVDYKLEFNKSQTNDRYYFNRYTATLPNEDPAKTKSQTFFMNSVAPNKDDSEAVKQMKRKAHGVTAKEAYNLLQGRSVYKTLVNKEKEPYNAWMKLNFSKQDQYGNNEVKKFTDKYGFDLDKTLDKYPIMGLDDFEKRQQLLLSLEKGNRLQVTFEKEGKEEKMLIEANPEYKNLEVYDSKGVRQRVNQSATRFTASENNTFSKSASQDNLNGKDASEDSSQKNGKKELKQNEGVVDAQKKTSQKRGMRA
ncbi:MAG TPA: hypothetical protein VD884_19020 [Ohtaekwangia sp.]|nr:hypothetical protein [Ohtaekwangia sp.]